MKPPSTEAEEVERTQSCAAGRSLSVLEHDFDGHSHSNRRTIVERVCLCEPTAVIRARTAHNLSLATSLPSRSASSGPLGRSWERFRLNSSNEYGNIAVSQEGVPILSACSCRKTVCSSGAENCDAHLKFAAGDTCNHHRWERYGTGHGLEGKTSHTYCVPLAY